MLKIIKNIFENLFIFLSIFSILYVFANYLSIYNHITETTNLYFKKNIDIEDTVLKNTKDEKNETFVLYDNSKEIKKSKDFTNFPGEKIIDSVINNLVLLDNKDTNIKTIKKEMKVVKEKVLVNNKKKKKAKKEEHKMDFFSLSQDIPETEGQYKNGSYIVIPKINVEAPIFYPSIEVKDLEGEILKILEKGVVHRPETQLPYQKGNFFLLGHSSNFPWIRSEYSNIFAKIDLLSIGDIVNIYYDGRKYTYTLYEKKIVDANALEVYGYIPGYNLSIMTCYPIGSVKSRMIAKFKLNTY